MVKRSRRRHQRVLLPLRRVLILTTVFFLILYASFRLYHYAMRPDVLPFRSVTLRSSPNYLSNERLKAILISNVKGGFFSLDEAALRKRVLEYAWIKRVSFRRVFPSTLEVKVVQRQPVAYWGAHGLLSADGVVFFPMLLNRRLPLPHFDGPIEYRAWLRYVYQFCTQQLVPLHLSVTSLDLNKRLTLRLVLSNDVLVIMGSDDWQHRFARFVALYKKVQHQQTKMIKQVDLRYPNGVAVTY